MPKSYRSFTNAKYYYAIITPDEQTDGVKLKVYSTNWKGDRVLVSSKVYKNEYAAEQGLKTHYPDADWQEDS